MRFVAFGTLAALSAAAPAPAFAVDYLTAEQAMKLMFADADRFEPREVALAPEQLAALAASGVKPRSARWPVRAAMKGDETLGWFVVDEVVGKFELITYAVAIGRDGVVRPIEVLSYRESHGGEIRLASWRRQFAGKTVASPIRVGDDIASISGATLSCTHVADGVRRIVAVVDAARRAGQLG